MFSKYEEIAKKLAGLDRKIIIVTGTGFNDLKELQTDDFRKLLKNEEADFNKIWELYIAVKIAIKMGKEGYYCGENIRENLLILQIIPKKHKKKWKVLKKIV